MQCVKCERVFQTGYDTPLEIAYLYKLSEYSNFLEPTADHYYQLNICAVCQTELTREIWAWLEGRSLNRRRPLLRHYRCPVDLACPVCLDGNWPEHRTLRIRYSQAAVVQLPELTWLEKRVMNLLERRFFVSLSLPETPLPPLPMAGLPKMIYREGVCSVTTCRDCRADFLEALGFWLITPSTSLRIA